MTKAKLVICLLISLFFLALGLVSDVYFNEASSDIELASRISKSLKRELSRVEQEAVPFLKQPADPVLWQKQNSSFFLIDSLTVLAWTQNEFLPELPAMQESFTLKLVQVTQGVFLIRKWPIRGHVFLLCVLPLQKDYHIVNSYLSPEWNPAIFSKPVNITESSGSGEGVLLPDGRCIFRIQDPESRSEFNRVHEVGLTLITLAIASFLVFVFGLMRRLHQQKKYGVTFLGLTVSLFALRIVMVKANFPNALSDFSLFDPHRFASSSFNASMGDLLLNAAVILVLCLYLFMNYPKLKIIRSILAAPRVINF